MRLLSLVLPGNISKIACDSKFVSDLSDTLLINSFEFLRALKTPAHCLYCDATKQLTSNNKRQLCAFNNTSLHYSSNNLQMQEPQMQQILAPRILSWR